MQSDKITGLFLMTGRLREALWGRWRTLGLHLEREIRAIVGPGERIVCPLAYQSRSVTATTNPTSIGIRRPGLPGAKLVASTPMSTAKYKVSYNDNVASCR